MFFISSSYKTLPKIYLLYYYHYKIVKMCTEKVGTFQLLYDPALGQTQCRDRAGIGSTGRHPEQYRKVHNIIYQKMSFFIL